MKIRCVLIIAVLMLFSSCSQNLKYPISRDAHEVFGDGRFVIVNVSGDTPYCLFDEKNNRVVENSVINYTTVSSCIYTVGTDGMNPKTKYGVTDSYGNVIWDSVEENIYYTKVDFETGSIYQYTDINKYEKEDKKVFNRLQKEAN